MENKIIAIEVGSGVSTFDLEKRENFTTNKNYLGHNKYGIPVYFSPLLNKGEHRNIMNNEKIVNLPEGKYYAKVNQVIRKHGKDKNGDEDPNKDIISIELNVEGHGDRFYYLTYCVNGYMQQQQDIAKEQIMDILDKFGIESLEQLEGQIVMVTSKISPKGYTNLYIAPKKEFFDWSTFEGFKYTDTIKHPAYLKKFYAGKVGRKVIFVLQDTELNIEEYVIFNLDYPFNEEKLEKTLKKFGISPSDQDEDFSQLEKKCNLIVKKVSKNGKTFYNKTIGFDKIERKPELFTLSDVKIGK